MPSSRRDGLPRTAPSVQRILVHNEFALVAVELLGGPGRERLSIADLRTNQTIELDALELESLAWSTHEDLERLLDPGQTRWVGTG